MSKKKIEVYQSLTSVVYVEKDDAITENICSVSTELVDLLNQLTCEEMIEQKDDIKSLCDKLNSVINGGHVKTFVEK